MIACQALSFSLESLVFPTKRNSVEGTKSRSFDLRQTPHYGFQKCCCWSIEGKPTSQLTSTIHDDENSKKKQFKTEEQEGERKVNCEVEVISWRERRIKAHITVCADIQSVWNALTDYELLADFIPNLICRLLCASSNQFHSLTHSHT